MKNKVVDLREFRDRAGRDERRSRQQLYPKSQFVQAVPRKRPATRGYLSPPQTPPGGDAA